MRENGPLAKLRDLPVALSLLSRLPVAPDEADYARSAQGAWAWPLVGLVLAGLAAFVAIISQALGIPSEISSILALATLVALTGAMHEDGLADTADGFWGGVHRARRLEIMRDSRIGTYGVIALVLSLGLRAMALILLGILMVPAMLAAAALSRAAMVAAMAALPNARPDGLSQHVGRPGPAPVALAIALASIAALLLAGWAALGAALAAALAALTTGLLARNKIGGQTGDVLGATQQVTEIAALLAFASIA